MEYREYQQEIEDALKILNPGWPFSTEPVEFVIHVGLSSKLADLDNVLKPLFDTYQGIYEEFNDKTVYKITATKELVDRGREFLDVEVRQFEETTSESNEEETN